MEGRAVDDSLERLVSPKVGVEDAEREDSRCDLNLL